MVTVKTKEPKTKKRSSSRADEAVAPKTAKTRQIAPAAPRKKKPAPRDEEKRKKKSAKQVEDELAVEESTGEDFGARGTERYFEAVGRRKTAIARVRLFTKGERVVMVNGKPMEDYFSAPGLREVALASLKRMKILDKFFVSIRLQGGGLHAQAEAIRHATARALVQFNPDFRKRLKRSGFLRRDPRMVERKKPGLKKARKAPQWSKR